MSHSVNCEQSTRQQVSRIELSKPEAVHLRMFSIPALFNLFIGSEE